MRRRIAVETNDIETAARQLERGRAAHRAEADDRDVVVLRRMSWGHSHRDQESRARVRLPV